MFSQGKEVGFEAWVEARDDKKRLNVYQMEHHPAKDGQPAYTECFLETIDEPFRIVIEKLPGFRNKLDWQCQCLVDGIDLEDDAWPKETDRVERDHVYHQPQDGSGVLKSSLKFAPMQTSDDNEKITVSDEALTKYGTIEIILRRIIFTFVGTEEPAVTSLQQGIINEKCAKPTEDENVELYDVDSYTFRYPRGKGKSSYRFLFKYRPRVELIRAKIIAATEADAGLLGPGPSKKRKRQRMWNPIDLTISSDEEERPGVDVYVKSEQEFDFKEEDIKPHKLARRNKYLEERNSELLAEVKRLRGAKRGEGPAVDLTLDD
ncbi:hypothetical protein IAT40_000575 [Kwoniella sp. CBS 6097]